MLRFGPVKLVELFPFPPGEQIKDEAVRKNAIASLRVAKAGEEKVVEALKQVVDADWGG